MQKIIQSTMLVLLLSSTAYADGVDSDYQMFLKRCAQRPVPEDIAADCLYGFEDKTFMDAKDRFAHPRSVKEYRAIVGDDEDSYGMCRAAAHIKYCIKKLHELSGEED